MGPVCGTSEACTKSNAQVSVWLAAGALSDRYQSGPGTGVPNRGVISLI